MKIAVGCDHAGYVLKLMAMDHLVLRPEVRLQDFGTYSEERVDYPDIASGKASSWFLLHFPTSLRNIAS